MTTTATATAPLDLEPGDLMPADAPNDDQPPPLSADAQAVADAETRVLKAREALDLAVAARNRAAYDAYFLRGARVVELTQGIIAARRAAGVEEIKSPRSTIETAIGGERTRRRNAGQPRRGPVSDTT